MSVILSNFEHGVPTFFPAKSPLTKLSGDFGEVKMSGSLNGLFLFLRRFRRCGGEGVQAHCIESTRDRGPIEEEIERTEGRLIPWNIVICFKSSALSLIEDANQNIANVRPSWFSRNIRVVLTAT